MTAYELRAILDRFHKALRGIEDWAEAHRETGEPHPEANIELHRIWCALDRECKVMWQAEWRPPPPDPTTLKGAAAICYGKRA